MVFHGKSTRGNTSTNQEQTSQSAPQSMAAPATGDTENPSTTSQGALTKKKAPSRTVNHQEGQLASAPPIVLFTGTVLTVCPNEAVDSTNSTSLFLKQGRGKSGRTTTIGAGGATAGELVGDLASGGKGALIGSAVGAGDGIAGSAFTGNYDLVVPAESLTSIQTGASIET